MHKKTTKVILGASTVIALAALGRPEAQAATANISMVAFVVDSNLIVASTTALKFGNIFPGGTGTVTVKAGGGAPATTGTVSLAGGAPHPGGFKIRGQGGLTATFTLAPKTVTLSNGGGSTMKVGTFKIGTSSATTGAYTLPLTGSVQTGIPIGGTLHVEPGQASGAYTGSVNLTANYK